MVRRRALLTAAGIAPVAGLAGTAGPARAAVGTLATVSVNAGTSLGAFPFRPGGQLSATPKSWRYGEQTLAALGALRLRRARVWLKWVDMAPATAGAAPAYEAAHPYLDRYHGLAESLLLNWQTGHDGFATAPGFDRAAFVAAQRDALAHFKRRYPKIDMIEVENEDFRPGTPVADYYRKYRVMYEAVAAVNALSLPGPKLMVGGPTLDIFSETRLRQFLDAYRADKHGLRRLDFVSYHQYLINTGDGPWWAEKDHPAVVATERATVARLLRERGLPDVPVVVSEVGVFPMTRASELGLDADLHIQAAGVASLHYHYAGQRDIIPFDWTVDHPENDRKDLFVDTDTGQPRPYYNALRMLSMLPPTRCQADSDALTGRGTGVYALAAVTPAGVSPAAMAVLTWNYHWTGQRSFSSRIVVSGLPDAFRAADDRVTRYRQDPTVPASALRPVESFMIGPRTTGTYHGQTLPLGPNEFRLTVLSPGPGTGT